MTILSRSAIQPGFVTVQCDVCFPQHIASNTFEAHAERGWLLRDLGAQVDMCNQCRYEPHQGHTPRIERARDQSSTEGFLPNFFIVGAAKAGTTSLFYYLDQHPDIYMTRLKELHYFCDPECSKWLSLYRQQFPVDARVRGEASTLYTRSPAIPGAAERMATLVPDARLVYLVRDPVDRALASWREERFHLTDRRPASQAFAHPEDPHNPYVAGSRYAVQLQGLLDHFPEEQVLVLDQRDLSSDGSSTVERVLRFLELPPHDVDTTVRYNDRSTKLEYGNIGHRLRFSAPARAVRRMPLPLRRAITAPARRFLRRPIAEPDLPHDLMERTRAVLAADAELFRQMTGMAFDHWSV